MRYRFGGMVRERYPKAFNNYWEKVDTCGINENDDFKEEAYLAWMDGRNHPKPLETRNTRLITRTNLLARY